MDTNLVLKAYQLNGEYESVHATHKNIKAVSNVSLELQRAEVIGIAGESGCGKSTLLNMLYGYVKWPLALKAGSVELFFDNEEFNMYSLSFEERRRKIWWKHVSRVPQNAMNVLNPTMRIKDHFAEMFKLHMDMNKKEAYSQAQNYSESMNLPKDALSAFPHQLSGGMKQRVVVAMAISLKPQLILADEPSSALDVVTQRAVLTLLLKIQKKLGNTLVVVSHDLSVHSVLTDKIAIMYAGKIVEVGETQKLFEEPLHPYTRALIKSLPLFGSKSYKAGLKGQPPDLTDPPLGCRFHERCPYMMQICIKEEPTLFRKGGSSVACWLCERY